MSSFGRRMSSFGPRLAAIALVGLAARLAYGFLADAPHGIGDDIWYHAVANGIADGRGYSDPFSSVGEGGRELFGDAGSPLPTAFHPPLFPALLALASLLGATSYDAHQAIGCALGAATVAVTGLAARRLGGERLGMLAAAIAAIYPPLVANDSLLMSESLYGLTVGLARSEEHTSELQSHSDLVCRLLLEKKKKTKKKYINRKKKQHPNPKR